MLWTGEAIAVLLRTWNSAYYRYPRGGTADYTSSEALLDQHGDWLGAVAERPITSLATHRSRLEPI
jgi:hypothetical protein